VGTVVSIPVEKQARILLGTIGVVFFVGGIIMPCYVTVIHMSSGGFPIFIPLWRYSPITALATILLFIAAAYVPIWSSSPWSWIAPLVVSVIAQAIVIVVLILFVITAGNILALEISVLPFPGLGGRGIGLNLLAIMSLYISFLALLAESIIVRRSNEELLLL
jgi:hypothetical protein